MFEAYTRRTSVMTSRSGHGQTNKEDHQAIWQAPSGDKSSLWYNLPEIVHRCRRDCNPQLIT